MVNEKNPNLIECYWIHSNRIDRMFGNRFLMILASLFSIFFSQHHFFCVYSFIYSCNDNNWITGIETNQANKNERNKKKIDSKHMTLTFV